MSVPEMEGGLTLRKMCGIRVCPPYYRCSKYDYQCYPCVNYCDESYANYDYRICELQCQDYIHDFIKQYTTEDELRALLKIVENKKLFISILTVFNVIVFLILFISFGYWFFTRNKKTEDDDNTGVYFENKLSSLQYTDGDVNDDDDSMLGAARGPAESVDMEPVVTHANKDVFSFTTFDEDINTGNSDDGYVGDEGQVKFIDYDHMMIKTAP